MSLHRLLAALVGLLAAAGAASAGSPMHPEIELLGEDGKPVLETGAPVSARATCGACHDAEFISGHGQHAWLGFDERRAPGAVPGGRPWDESPGAFGRWDPAAYRRLTVGGDTAFDLGVADWLRSLGRRHAGGGPAVVRADGRRHGEPGGLERETHAIDPATGRPTPWDWKASGTAEFNCFLCHVRDADDDARAKALTEGRFGWASTATLAGTGLAEPDGRGTWRWVRERFQPDGTVARERLGIGDPSPARCGACHMDVPEGPSLVGAAGVWAARDPAAAGQVFSAQRVCDSALNLAGKDARTQPWDVHAARLLGCTECHHALNNPVRFAEAERSRPRHLAYDARRPEVGDYLRTPDHEITKGWSARPHASRGLDGSMRRCEGCHAADEVHARWLPATARHLSALLCETCHVPEVVAPAVETTDWTVLTASRGPRIVHRGVEGDPRDPASLITGYAPVVLPRREGEGRQRLGPHHLSTTWYWTGGAPRRPVRAHDLEAAWFDASGAVRPEIVAALDLDGDGRLAEGELRLDTEAKASAVRAALAAAGVADPRIEGAIEPSGLHHGVVPGRLAVRDCASCHGPSSRLAKPFELSPYRPAGALAALPGDTNVSMPGRVEAAADGRLVYAPAIEDAGRRVAGLHSAGWVDRVGLAAVLAVLLGVVAHGALRAFHARRGPEAS